MTIDTGIGRENDSEATSGISGVVQLTKTVGAPRHGMHSGHGYRNRERFLMLQHLSASLPGEGPRRYDGNLGDEEDRAGDDGLAEVDAHAHRRYVLAFDENGVPRRGGVR